MFCLVPALFLSNDVNMANTAYGDLSSTAMKQVEGIKNIPYQVYMNWPAFFGFAAVDYAAAMFYNVIPQFGGTLGTVERAAIGGWFKVLDFVAWEQLRHTA
jgi:hypothetical protein